MISRYQVLAKRIQVEIDDLERTVDTVERHWLRFKTTSIDPDAYLNSVALNLHSFYTGLEHILELVVEEIDGGVLGGEAWHAELLRQVHLDLPDIRPPVLSQEMCEQLDEYRKFRHRVRNIYAMNLLPCRMEDLVANLPAVWHKVRTELQVFTNFLNQLPEAE